MSVMCRKCDNTRFVFGYASVKYVTCWTNLVLRCSACGEYTCIQPKAPRNPTPAYPFQRIIMSDEVQVDMDNYLEREVHAWA
jgi:hypothetical protein